MKKTQWQDEQGGSLMARDQYFRELKWVTPFEDGEEEKLLQRLLRASREPGNAWLARLARAARDRLVEAYQPFVVKIAAASVSRFRGMELLDLVSEGNLGLLQAIEQYPKRENFHQGRFSKLVGACVRHALYEAYGERDVMVRLPEKIRVLLNQARKVREELQARLEREPLSAEVAEVLGVNESVLLEMMAYQQHQYVESLQGLIDEDDAEDRHDFASLYQAAEVDDHTHQEEREQLFQRAFDQVLTPYQREVMMLRYGIGEEKGSLRSYHVVSEMIGHTSNSVGSTEAYALEKLRQVMKQEVSSDGRVSYVFEQPSREEYYTAKEAAQVMGKTVEWVRCLGREGRLPMIERSGYVDRVLFLKEAVDTYVVARREAKAALEQSDGYYTVQEVAHVLDVSKVWVLRLVKEQRLPAEYVKVSPLHERGRWLVAKEVVHAYMAARVSSKQVCQSISA